MKKRMLLTLSIVGIAGLLVGCDGKKVSSTVTPGSSTNPAPSSTSSTATKIDYKHGLGTNIALQYAKDGETTTEIVNQINITVGSVIFDSADKVVSAYIDEVQIPVTYTAGTDSAQPTLTFTSTATQVKDAGAKNVESKKELKERYNMYQPDATGSHVSKLAEWFEQAAALEDWTVGKTVAQIKAGMGTDGYPTDNDLKAGCTINIASDVAVIESALANAKTASYTGTAPVAGAGIIVGAVSTKSAENAVTGFQIDVDMSGSAVTGDKISGTSVDVYQIPLTQEGKLNKTATQVKDAGAKVIESKRQLGDRYGMYVPEAPEGSHVSKLAEWYDQAASFETWAVGKTAANLAAGMGADSYPTDDSLKAGCTISIAGFVGSVSESITMKK